MRKGKNRRIMTTLKKPTLERAAQGVGTWGKALLV
jgi:hypothetical protein